MNLDPGYGQLVADKGLRAEATSDGDIECDSVGPSRRGLLCSELRLVKCVSTQF